MKIKNIIGRLMYVFAKRFPETDAKFNFGGAVFRRISSKLFLNQCGNHVNIDRNAIIGNNVSVGDYSGIGKNSYIGDYVQIGAYVMMGADCLIYTRNHKYDNIEKPMCFQGFQEYRPVIIGDDVWIGGRVIILPGVKVGDGSIIGAGSVVTKNVEKYTIVAGNPARLIRKRK